MARAIAFLLLLVIPAAYAATYTVGGSQGWSTGVDYTAWASGLTFATGDTLVFNYGLSHTVDEVTAGEYQSCSSANPISANANSPTTISLTTPGTRYFVCLRSNHCAQGMKLAVTVAAASGSPTPPSPTTPSPPSGGATPSPPSGTPRTPTTTPAGGAATTLGGGISLIVGSLLVFAAVLMG